MLQFCWLILLNHILKKLFLRIKSYNRAQWDDKVRTTYVIIRVTSCIFLIQACEMLVKMMRNDKLYPRRELEFDWIDYITFLYLAIKSFGYLRSTDDATIYLQFDDSNESKVDRRMCRRAIAWIEKFHIFRWIFLLSIFVVLCMIVGAIYLPLWVLSSILLFTSTVNVIVCMYQIYSTVTHKKRRPKKLMWKR